MACFVLVTADATIAQCPHQWSLVEPALNNEPKSMILWDPDGPGASPPVVVVGGFFTQAGPIPLGHIGAFDPRTSTWSTLAGGMDGPVDALAVLRSGELVAAGAFTQAGQTRVSGIARWDGALWRDLGTDGPSTAARLMVLPGGDLIAVSGHFDEEGNLISTIFRWDGTTWSQVLARVSGPQWPWIAAMAVLPNGHLVIAGNFSSIEELDGNATAARNIARWDGALWSPLDGGLNAPCRALAVHPNGDLVAGGEFDFAAGASARRIAVWNGAAWAALGEGFGVFTNSQVYALAVAPNGNLIAGGFFSTAGVERASNIARWQATAWEPLGSSAPSNFGLGIPNWSFVQTLVTLPGGDILAGGRIHSADGQVAGYLFRLPHVCHADFDCSGAVDADDLSDFITCFLLDVQSPASCPGADFNQDASRDPDDLSDFLTAFFLSAQPNC